MIFDVKTVESMRRDSLRTGTRVRIVSTIAMFKDGLSVLACAVQNVKYLVELDLSADSKLDDQCLGQDTLWLKDGAAFRESQAEISDGAPIRVSMAETPDGAAIRVLLAEIPNGMGYKLTYADPDMFGCGQRSRRTVLCMPCHPNSMKSQPQQAITNLRRSHERIAPCSCN
jgi:hypothetical protein